MRLFQGYGAIAEEDARVLEAALRRLISDRYDDTLYVDGVIRVLEIGVDCGGTARGIRDFLRYAGWAIDYYGIDPGLLNPLRPPFTGATIIKGYSETSFHLVPSGGFDLILVDGNHSRNSVILDVFNYESKVAPGGFMLFHDTNPGMQGQDYQYAGPKIPEFHVAVNEALALIGFPWEPWVLWKEDWPKDSPRCGMRAYRKGAP